MAGTSTLPELEKKIASAEKEVESAKTSGDTDLLKLYLADLTELRKKENLLLQQQQPGSRFETPPSITLHITREAISSLASGSDADFDVKSYAPSSTSYSQALEAAERVGWELLPSTLHTESTSNRQAVPFVWDEREDDSTSRQRVLAELNAELNPPSSVRIISIERKVLVVTEKERDTKRTKLQAKTDYVALLRSAEQFARIDPSAILQFVVMLFETKTSEALGKSPSKAQGAAAIESLAVHLKLLDLGLLSNEDEGIPVVLTDMNSFMTYLVPRVGDEKIVRRIYEDKAVAYDDLSSILRRASEAAVLKHLRPSAEAVAEPQVSGHAGGLTSSAHVDPNGGLSAIDFNLGVRNIAETLVPSSAFVPQRTVVYMEDLGQSVLRAVVPGYSPNQSSAGFASSFSEMPSQFAHMYT